MKILWRGHSNWILLERYSAVLLFIMLCSWTFWSMEEIQMKHSSTKQDFPVLLFITLYELVLITKSVNKILWCDYQVKLASFALLWVLWIINLDFLTALSEVKGFGKIISLYYWLLYHCHVAYRFVHSCAILSCSSLSFTYWVAMLPTRGSPTYK